MAVIDIEKVSSKTLQEWESVQFVPKQRYFVDKSEPIVKIKKYEVVELDSQFDNDWIVIRFEHKGKPYEFEMRTRKLPKPGLQMTAQRFVALEGFTAPNGKEIAEGTPKWYCVQI